MAPDASELDLKISRATLERILRQGHGATGKITYRYVPIAANPKTGTSAALAVEAQALVLLPA
jgi:hypothetical protein